MNDVITISRSQSTTFDEDIICIEIRKYFYDKHITTEVVMSLADFASAITGQGRLPCEISDSIERFI